jgi:hypothetical protein
VNDATNNAVRAVDPAGITVKTFAGCYDDGAAPCTQPTAFANGTGANSAYFDFSGHGTMIAFDPVTHDLYTADYSNAVYRQITTAASYGSVPAVVTTWVGVEGHAGNVNGLGNASNFSSAWGLVWTSSGLFIATENNNRDLRIIL